MKKILLLSSFVCFVILLSAQSISRDVVSSSGDYYENTGVSISWTLGEAMIQTYTGTNNIMTQGFQQSKLTIVKIDKPDEGKFDCKIYPNPTSDYIIIELKDNFSDLNIDVFDINGRMLKSQDVNSDIVKIDFSKFSKAKYLIKVTNDNTSKFKTYSVIKN